MEPRKRQFLEDLIERAFARSDKLGSGDDFQHPPQHAGIGDIAAIGLAAAQVHLGIAVQLGPDSSKLLPQALLQLGGLFGLFTIAIRAAGLLVVAGQLLGDCQLRGVPTGKRVQPLVSFDQQ